MVLASGRFPGGLRNAFAAADYVVIAAVFDSQKVTEKGRALDTSELIDAISDKANPLWPSLTRTRSSPTSLQSSVRATWSRLCQTAASAEFTKRSSLRAIFAMNADICATRKLRLMFLHVHTLTNYS